ncbi:bifunctional YncE family protein/alkaline phosphatase family protein [bacterium]|nr:bifunctional YncE family protein/alkaline phosphatase family protein [bacterium]
MNAPFVFSRRWMGIALALGVLLIVSGCASGGTPESGANDAAAPEYAPGGRNVVPVPEVDPKADEPQATPDAYLRPGDLGDGRYVLPNGRMISPAGDIVGTASFPMDVAVSPDGQTAIVTTAKHSTIHVVDVATRTVTDIRTLSNVYSGLVFDAAGERFWVSGGASHKIFEFTLAGGVITQEREIPLPNMPSGLALSPDESRLYAACYMGKRVAVIDLDTGAEIDSLAAHLFSVDVKVTPDGARAFVANQGPNTVSAIDIATGAELANIPVGANPTLIAMSPDGSRVYVPNADSDDVSVIDTASLTEIARWELHPGAQTIGASPVAADVSPDGTRLYVTNAGYNSVDVIDMSNGAVLGRIPTGWYPTNAFVDGANDLLFVTNGKGEGSAGLGLWDNWQGSVSIVDLPSAPELADYTTQVENNVRFSLSHFDLSGEILSPIPTTWGAPSQDIKKVFFILRENKTFDQILGDLEGVEADPDLVNFGEFVTPNAYKLARTYTVLDNCYSEGDTSVLGHLWGTFSMVNDHAEKAYSAPGFYPISDFDEDTRPPSGSIFANLLDNDVPFRSYGQVVGMAEDLERFAPYMDFKYGFWNMGVDDRVKITEIFREIEAGIFEPFTYIVLPNDHTYGSKSGAPTARYLVADNDEALGRLVESLSNRDDWGETAIFVIEDDPQSGTDHIDPHRVPCLVISPWAKRDHVSSVLATTANIWSTIEHILGIPAMTKYDEFASPLYDAFTATPDLTPYEAIPSNIPFEVNTLGLPWQAYCDDADFTTPDAVENLGRVLWDLTRPGDPWPEQYALPEDGEDEAEEHEETETYRRGIAKALTWAREHGIDIPGYTSAHPNPRARDARRD